jgi:hypothetical protein
VGKEFKPLAAVAAFAWQASLSLALDCEELPVELVLLNSGCLQFELSDTQ